ncbi:MAG: sensor domain-containing diguanylate cyclase [Candidatus Omnitrophota bacterium]|nr:sensor domain-containing diguanylate cyclase [Candidatus Omnitrophota bacterium]
MKKNLSIRSVSLKRRIWVAVSLVTFIPSIIVLYYFSGIYISPPAVLIAAFIVFLGWWIIFEIFSSILRLYSNSKKTLKNIGEEAPEIANEVQSLEAIVNMFSSKMKGSLEQLKDFSQKTEELNQEVSKKVFVLSTIIQANDLFSKDAPSEDILQLLTQRLKEILAMKVCFCISRDEDIDKFTVVSYFGMDVSKIEDALEKEGKELIKLKKIMALDKENKSSQVTSLAKELGVNNIALNPITSKGQLIGFLVIANNSDNFVFSADNLNILSLFSQNVSLVWEHKKLSVKVDSLEILDYLTGLYNEKFIVKRLDEEINRALIYQRPCGFLLMEIINFEECQKTYGLLEAEKLVKKVARVFKETLRPIDIAARLAPNRLGAILIEKNKRQSQTVASNLKEKLENSFKDQLKLAFSVAENPIDGANSHELISFAQSHISISGINEAP